MIWRQNNSISPYTLTPGFRETPLHLHLEALAQLTGRLPREGHRGDALDVRRAGLEQRQHAIDELRGLPRSRPGLDEQIHVQVLGDLLPGTGIPQGQLQDVWIGHALGGGVRGASGDGRK